jgi:hypothetical protein
MSRADAHGRISLSALRRAALRCADRLRRLWLDDRIVTSSRTELSSLVSRQTLLDRVSIVASRFAEKPSEAAKLFFPGFYISFFFLIGCPLKKLLAQTRIVTHVHYLLRLRRRRTWVKE